MSTAGIFEQSCTDGEDGIPISEAEKQRKYSALWQVSEIVALFRFGFIYLECAFVNICK